MANTDENSSLLSDEITTQLKSAIAAASCQDIRSLKPSDDGNNQHSIDILSDTFEEAEVIVNKGQGLGFVDIGPLQAYAKKPRPKRTGCFRPNKKNRYK